MRSHDYVEFLQRSILSLPTNDLRARRPVYEQATTAQKSFLESQDPPFDSEVVDYETKLLRYTIRAIETDIRAGVDIADQQYAPRGLDLIRRKLLEARDAETARRRVIAIREARLSGAVTDLDLLTRDLSQEDRTRLERLRTGLAFLDPPGKTPARGYPNQDPISVIRATFILQLQLIASESRFALIWTLISPAVLLTLISLIYFLLQTQYILNMDVPTFALTGSATWIMCRQVIFRVSTAMVHNRVLINIPMISTLHTTVSQAVLYLVIYTVVFLALLTAGHFAGLTSLPNSVPRFVLPILGMWVIAYSIGLIFGYVTTFWPYFLRLASVIERALQLFSSVFFVSEQLPESLKPYVLWSPTAHGMQLIRAGYFAGYTAPDASVRYFCVSVASILIVALILERLCRTRIQPM